MPPRRRSDLVIPRESSEEESQYTLRVPDAEYLLLQHLTELKVDSALCTSLGRGQLAAHLAELAPKAKVTCFFFDQYLADDTIDYHAGKHPRLQIMCGADLPERKADQIGRQCQLYLRRRDPEGAADIRQGRQIKIGREWRERGQRS